MRLETFSGSNLIVVQYAKGTEVDTVRIKVLVKAESMITIQPVMLGMSSCICFMYYFFHKNCPFSYLFICLVNKESSLKVLFLHFI